MNLPDGFTVKVDITVTAISSTDTNLHVLNIGPGRYRVWTGIDEETVTVVVAEPHVLVGTDTSSTVRWIR